MFSSKVYNIWASSLWQLRHCETCLGRCSNSIQNTKIQQNFPRNHYFQRPTWHVLSSSYPTFHNIFFRNPPEFELGEQWVECGKNNCDCNCQPPLWIFNHVFQKRRHTGWLHNYCKQRSFDPRLAPFIWTLFFFCARKTSFENIIQRFFPHHFKNNPTKTRPVSSTKDQRSNFSKIQ